MPWYRIENYIFERDSAFEAVLEVHKTLNDLACDKNQLELKICTHEFGSQLNLNSHNWLYISTIYKYSSATIVELCKQRAELKAELEKYKLKWFKPTKPVEDGWYRLEEPANFANFIHSKLINGSLMNYKSRRIAGPILVEVE